jgi:hypothetical protein
MKVAELFWTVGDVAKEARKCSQWVRLREQAGKIKAVRTVGGLRLFRDADVRALLLLDKTDRASRAAKGERKE